MAEAVRAGTEAAASGEAKRPRRVRERGRGNGGGEELMLCFPSRTGGPTHGFPFFSQENAGKSSKYAGSSKSTPKGDLSEEVREREKKRRGGIDLVFTVLTPPSFSPPLPSFHRTSPPRGPTLGTRTPTMGRFVCERERERKGGGRIDLVFTVLTPPPSPSPLLHSAPPAAGPPAPPPARSPPRRSTSTRSSRRRSRPRRTRSWTTSSAKGST